MTAPFIGYQGERELLEQHWEKNWIEGTSPLTPTAYENVPFQVPAAGAWARLSIVNAPVTQITSGNPGANTHRHPGVIQVELYSPAQEGSANIRRLMDLAAAIFRNQKFGDGNGLRTWEASARLTGVDGAYQRALVRWEFWRDESL